MSHPLNALYSDPAWLKEFWADVDAAGEKYRLPCGCDYRFTACFRCTPYPPMEQPKEWKGDLGRDIREFAEEG